MPLVWTLSFLGTLVADIAAWAVIHAGTGYLVHRRSTARLQRDGWLLRVRPWEHYRRLGIDRWKDRLPEAGALFAGGVSKRSVGRADLAAFVVETRRAELGHWLAIACIPLFALWNPPSGVVLMAVYGVLVNAPFIAVQRYNRRRALRVLDRREVQTRSRSTGSRSDLPSLRSRTRGRSMP
jgi:glycosyl-4,4'-diaponeurosporenoate acyltransferase